MRHKSPKEAFQENTSGRSPNGNSDVSDFSLSGHGLQTHMDSVPQLLSRDSAILAALSQTDPSVWCFLPLSDDLPASCSSEFNVQWGPMPSDAGVDSVRNTSAAMIRQALGQFGIAPQAFQGIEQEYQPGPASPIRIERVDGVKLDAFVSVITEPDGTKIGHLLRFRPPAETTITEAILSEVTEAQERLAALSPRETEVLSLVYQGRTNKAISSATGTSEKTVEKHRSRIMKKLGLTCHAALYRLVSRALLFSDRDPSGAMNDVATHAENSGSIPTPHLFRLSDRIRRE